MSGNAVLDACSRIAGRLLEVAAEMLGEPAILDAARGAFVGSSGAGSLPVAEVVRECHSRKVDLTAVGWYDPPECRVDQASGQGRAYNAYASATDVAQVEVDVRTGQVVVTWLAAIHDSGRIVNPLTASGQVEGGVTQGIGLAVVERYLQAGGRVASGDLSTYLVPTSLDLGDAIAVDFVESPSSCGPFGAKGLGEPAIIAAPAAVANAVSNALGVRVKSLPVDREWIAGLARPIGS
jgi:CO/xanthine dehydrogenase Mo-binding subunit